MGQRMNVRQTTGLQRAPEEEGGSRVLYTQHPPEAKGDVSKSTRSRSAQGPGTMAVRWAPAELLGYLPLSRPPPHRRPSADKRPGAEAEHLPKAWQPARALELHQPWSAGQASSRTRWREVGGAAHQPARHMAGTLMPQVQGQDDPRGPSLGRMGEGEESQTPVPFPGGLESPGRQGPAALGPLRFVRSQESRHCCGESWASTWLPFS